MSRRTKYTLGFGFFAVLEWYVFVSCLFTAHYPEAVFFGLAAIMFTLFTFFSYKRYPWWIKAGKRS